MEKDIATIVEYINQRRDPELPELPKNLHSINVNPQRRRYKKVKKNVEDNFYKRREGCISAVNRVLHKDFVLLGYDKYVPVKSNNKTFPIHHHHLKHQH